jgi:hypothetical protein
MILIVSSTEQITSTFYYTSFVKFEDDRLILAVGIFNNSFSTAQIIYRKVVKRFSSCYMPV